MNKPAFDINVMASPHYSITLPSTGKKVKMRALLTKEHKALLIANESGDKIDAIEQCLNNCLITEVNTRELPIGDSEYLFLQMYINSNGTDAINANYHCAAPVENTEEESTEQEVPTEDDFFKNIVEQSKDMSPDEMIEETFKPGDDICGTAISANIDLSTAFVPEYTGDYKVKVNDDITILLEHPNISHFEENDPATGEGLFNLAVASIKEIYHGETTYSRQELDEQGVLGDILDQMETKTFKKIQKFIDDVPRLCCYVDVVCPTCGNTEKIMLRGIEDFFV